MNRATQNLENDHVHILQLTEVMEKMAKMPQLDPVYLDEVADLIRNFADGLHHAKEEELLFPLMIDKGFSNQNGPVAVMLHEHVLGRNFVKTMSEGSQELKNGNLDADQDVREALIGYATLLQAHIGKENNILFRLADNLMSMPEEDQLHEQFMHLDSGRDSGSSSDIYVQRVQHLVNLFLTK
ncbi:MAG TPA: cation-binding protein [Prolixibacteraceae bacterium]|nr:cation-binding protein [Prolixibacteraceae bacterium]